MPEYLTCYDYGMGGVWLYIEAATAAEIEAAHPALTVFEVPPAWWSAEMESLTRTHDFRDPFWKNWLSELKL